MKQIFLAHIIRMQLLGLPHMKMSKFLDICERPNYYLSKSTSNAKKFELNLEVPIFLKIAADILENIRSNTQKEHNANSCNRWSQRS
jgi:hypothetical protein